ncbi:amidohydrolase [Actinophytocola xinjiangensis]|uniref:Amidohydrolase n=1 Tax=Actinophytocola xinjiangensis TaxID=485602 RepID=A0A7Z0WE67_9PSEU|nr:amidohydrolase family protein [Actinophytocola xinjiangensis]OLF05259.1 amidohydrolase [Actinophytocola xinjiangensis]
MTGLIDVHAHFLTDDYVAAAVAAGHVRPDGMPGWAVWSLADHLSLMDTAGIATSVLSVSSPGVHFGDDGAARALARAVNEYGAGVAAARPERFAHFASLPFPDVAGSLAELTHALDVLGSAGVAILTNAHGVYPGDGRYAEVYAELDRRAATVFVHPTAPPNAAAVASGRPCPMVEFVFESTRAAADLVLGGVLARYPRIEWIFTHSGGALPVLADRVQLFADVFLGTPPATPVAEQLAGLWYDLAGTPFPTAAPALTGAFGDSRILYGSDYCWTPVPAALAHAGALDTAAQPAGTTWRALTTANAHRLLPATLRV